MTFNFTPKPYGLIAIVCLVAFFGCSKDNAAKKQTYTYTITTPVLKSRTEVFAALNGSAAEPVKTAGKFYIKNQFIYLNEVEKGIHIIDNSNPSQPKQVGFLNIPGNLDIAVRDNILYADTYTDLLAIDISNPKKAAIVKEIKNFYQRYYIYDANPDMMIAAVIKKDTTIEAVWYDCANCLYASANQATNNTKSNSGTAGSMASMVLMNDHLYALQESHSLGIVDISTPSSPKFDTTYYAGFDLETIYPFEDKLFLGSMTGMFMYDMTNPLAPVKLGEFSHGRACDPVVTDGKYAYVTLHAGTTCGGSANELNVIDINDLMNPILVKAYNLTKPKGLCKDGNLLFVCDDKSGVRLYDAGNVSDLKQLSSINIENAYDIIAGNNHAMVVTDDGLYQYDYSNTKSIRFLSKYALKNN
ncbi:MAG: hypothetical protein IT249_03730 [Chitinophagaceae bacterium]|nr:hypothetical protein [Chitinophagaceae bacterium]